MTMMGVAPLVPTFLKASETLNRLSGIVDEGQDAQVFAKNEPDSHVDNEIINEVTYVNHLEIYFGRVNPLDFINELFVSALEKLLYLSVENPTNQLTEDWDNLIILDACRYDTFAEVSTLVGDLEARISPASATQNWLKTVIGDNKFFDTIYISANPRITNYDSQFHAVDHVWNWGWDDELKIVPPETVAEATRAAHEDYPEKRLVTHFMQPHTPYIGPFAQEKIDDGTGDTAGRDRALGEEVSGDDWYHELDMLADGKISKETAKKAYRENLRLVLNEVEALISELDGKTVVTADHGDLFDEWAWPYPRRLSDHPPHVPALKLRKIPWLTVTGDERRETVSERPQSQEEFKKEHVTDRLRQLGYLNK